MCSDLVGSTALSAQQGASLFERRAETRLAEIAKLASCWRLRGGIFAADRNPEARGRALKSRGSKPWR